MKLAAFLSEILTRFMQGNVTSDIFLSFACICSYFQTNNFALTILTWKNLWFTEFCIKFIEIQGCCFWRFSHVYTVSYVLLILLSYRCLKNVIHQIDSKDEWLLLSVSFTAKFEFFFVLTFENASFFIVFILYPTERA